MLTHLKPLFPISLMGVLLLTQACSSNDSGNSSSTSSSSSSVSSAASSNPDQTVTLEFVQAHHEVLESAEQVVLIVSRSGSSTGALSVDYQTQSESAIEEEDFTSSQGTLEWADGDTTAKEIIITILNDSDTESTQSFSVELDTPTGNATLGAQSSTQINIIDDDAPECIDLEPTSITEDTTLERPCYQVRQTIEIFSNATLTILPGVTLIFDEGEALDVSEDGRLIAEGTETHPITFTGAIQAPGYWEGIEIQSLASSRISHSIIEFAGGSGFNEGSIGVSFEGRASIEHSTIRNSASYGLSIETNDATLERFSNNILTENEAPPIRLHVNHMISIDSSNQFTGNQNTFGESQDYIRLRNAGSIGVNRAQTWQNLGVPLHMPNTTVHARLEIEEGTTLLFDANAQLNINENGSLIAIGSEAAPITFTGAEETPGYWRGIQFSFNNNDNQMAYCIVEYAGEDGNGEANVTVFGQNGRLSLTNSTIRHSSGYGLYFGSGIDLILENNHIHNTATPITMDVNDLGLLNPTNQFADNINNHVASSGSSIATAQSIKNIGIPFRINRFGYTNVSNTLTIDPGVELQFFSGGGISISETGSLIAVGTAENPILFTGVEAAPGYWNGIQHTFSSSELNEISHAVFEYGGAEDGNTYGLVGYFGQDSRGRISNTVFRESLTNGIWIDNPDNITLGDGITFEAIGGMDIYIDN